MQALAIIVGLLAMVTKVLIMLVLVQFVISLLFVFNVASPRNEFLRQIYNSIDLLLGPVLRPVRKILPDTGAIDFSPLVLVLGLQGLIFVLDSILKA
jgi:YggT family protein